jgi:hypothetical protein
LFEMAATTGGDVAVFALLLLAALVILLTVAVFRVRVIMLPVAAAGLAILLALMLATKPGTGRPTPALNDAGTSGLVLAVCIAAIAVVHAVHLHVAGRKPLRRNGSADGVHRPREGHPWSKMG